MVTYYYTQEVTNKTLRNMMHARNDIVQLLLHASAIHSLACDNPKASTILCCASILLYNEVSIFRAVFNPKVISAINRRTLLRMLLFLYVFQLFFLCVYQWLRVSQKILYPHFLWKYSWRNFAFLSIFPAPIYPP